MPESSEAGTWARATTAGVNLGRWLSSGRAQSSSGAFCAWRDLSTDKLAFEYPEICGYALTWLAAARPMSERRRATGVRVASWLSERLSGGDLSAREGWEEGAVYTFDLGMIAAGLISFGRSIGSTRFERAGQEVAGILAEYIESDGTLQAVAPDGPQTRRSGEWSTDGSSHLLKCLQCLLLNGNFDAGRTLLEQAYAGQAADGHFVTQPGDAFVMLHPHLYAVEGLWIWSRATQDEAALSRARHATAWLWQHQLGSGGFPRWVSTTEAGPEQLDVTSQAVRVAVLTGLNPPGMEPAVQRLVACARADGGYGSALVYRPDDVGDHLNVWATMFGEQALMLAGTAHHSLAWHELV